MFGSKPPYQIFIDDTPTEPLDQKIARLARDFQKLKGEVPNFCTLPYADVQDGVPSVEGLTISLAHELLPGHVWLGVAHPGES